MQKLEQSVAKWVQDHTGQSRVSKPSSLSLEPQLFGSLLSPHDVDFSSFWRSLILAKSCCDECDHVCLSSSLSASALSCPWTARSQQQFRPWPPSPQGPGGQQLSPRVTPWGQLLGLLLCRERLNEAYNVIMDFQFALANIFVNWFPALVPLRAFTILVETRLRRLPGQCECSMGWCACCRESKASLLVGSKLSLSVSLFVCLYLSASLSNKLNGYYFTNTNVLQNSPFFKKQDGLSFPGLLWWWNDDHIWARSGPRVTSFTFLASWVTGSSLSNLSREPAVCGRRWTGNQISPICVHICLGTSLPVSGERVSCWQ